MNQAPLELDSGRATVADRTGFDIGWDHAHHGLVPPAEWLHAGTPVCQGWMAGKAVFGHRTLTHTLHTRQWLQLRLQAWRLGIAFEGGQVTPNFLSQIQTRHCPVRRVALGGAPGHADAAQVQRLNTRAGFAAGNLAVMSAQAAAALHDVDLAQSIRHARASELSGEAVKGLVAAEWWRLAALGAFTTPVPFVDAARLPLAVLPPNRVRLLNAAQGLQALVTQMFSSAGWSTRCQALGRMLPEHTLRHDFNLFVGAMAPRVLEAGYGAASLRQALEDAWLLDRVQRRWQHFVLSLGESRTEGLLARAAQAGLAGIGILSHTTERATEGWSLPPGDAARPVARRPTLVVQPAARRFSAADVPPAARPGKAPAPAAPASHA